MIYVPMARGKQKTGYINNDMFWDIYKRTHIGDCYSLHSQVKSMLRNQIKEIIDMHIIEICH